MKCPKCKGRGYTIRQMSSGRIPRYYYTPCVCHNGKLLPKRAKAIQSNRYDKRHRMRQYSRFRQH